MDGSELLTMPEAAMVAHVTVRDVNRVIDERIVPERFYTLDGGRRLRAMACPLVGFWFHAAKRITAEERALLIHRLSERMEEGTPCSPPADWIVQDGFLTVDLKEFAVSAWARHAELAAARAIVVEDPEILSGTPVIRGTRVPVHDVGACVASGMAMEEIRESYSSLDDRTIALAAVYAEAIPPRGRPRGSFMLPPGARLISHHVFPRRGSARQDDGHAVSVEAGMVKAGMAKAGMVKDRPPG